MKKEEHNKIVRQLKESQEKVTTTYRQQLVNYRDITKSVPCSVCGKPTLVSKYAHKIYCKECREQKYKNNPRLKASHNYRHSKKGKIAKQKDESSAFGITRAKKYLHSEKGWEKSKNRTKKYVREQNVVDYHLRFDRQRKVIKMLELHFKCKALTEHTLYELKDNKTNRRLRLDCYFPGLNIIVEINGAQHYVPVRFGNISLKKAEQNLRDYQRRERIKQAYCIKHNIKFIVIPYNIPMNQIMSAVNEQLGHSFSVLGKEFEFACSHRLNNDSISKDANKYIFSKCNNENGHGHNMKMLVEVAGFIDPLTGMIINFSELKRIVNKVISKLDHKDINKDVGLKISTCEVMGKLIWEELSIDLPNLHRLTLWESSSSRYVMGGN